MSNTNDGFTLTELLIVVGLIVILIVAVSFSLSGTLQKTRNIERVTTLQQYKAALELYYKQHHRYPGCLQTCDSSCPAAEYPASNNRHGFSYRILGGSGNCNPPGSGLHPSIRWTHSSETDGLLSILGTEGFIDSINWHDPLNEINQSQDTLYDCRYIVERDGGFGGFPGTGRDSCNVQRYVLHCGLEGENSEAQNDGGTHDSLYEVWGPNGQPWFCITDVP
ncbi:prepilin-type N-terminal cleavage/methylation domain-containing protein [Candidatus Roizmanbacteria bacterium]|nr:prepilin-type N-terminal cleavage/methylation domain-containing protein [Candidatus Roizmanbacteria bacterium]